MKTPIFVIFYQEVPLQSTVAGVSTATNYTGLSCTKHNRKPVLRNPLIQHKSRAPSTFCTVPLSGTMSSKALLSTLLHNWKQITAMWGGKRVPSGLHSSSLPTIPMPHNSQVIFRATAYRQGGEQAPPEAISGQGQPQFRTVCK